jgi:hypothetical protein
VGAPQAGRYDTCGAPASICGAPASRPLNKRPATTSLPFSESAEWSAGSFFYRHLQNLQKSSGVHHPLCDFRLLPPGSFFFRHLQNLQKPSRVHHPLVDYRLLPPVSVLFPLPFPFCPAQLSCLLAEATRGARRGLQQGDWQPPATRATAYITNVVYRRRVL